MDMIVIGGGIIGLIIEGAILLGIIVFCISLKKQSDDARRRKMQMMHTRNQGNNTTTNLQQTQQVNGETLSQQAVQEAPQSMTQEAAQQVEQETTQQTKATSGKARILLATGGQYAGARFRIDAPITMGSDRQQCHIIFGADVLEVCGVHCEVASENGVVYLTDKGASYSTLVNEERMLRANETIELQVGDSFRIGANETFRIE